MLLSPDTGTLSRAISQGRSGQVLNRTRLPHPASPVPVCWPETANGPNERDERQSADTWCPGKAVGDDSTRTGGMGRERKNDVTLMRSIKTCFRKYADFSGRAQRSEFWWFFLFILVPLVILSFIPLVVLLLLGVLLPYIAVTVRRVHDTGRSAWWVIIILVMGALSAMALSAFILLEFASDSSGNDGFYGLLALLIIGGIWVLVSGVVVIALLVLCALPGTVGPNRYGPDPLRPELGVDMTRQPAHPYSATPAAVDDGSPGNDAAPTESLPETEPDNQRYCTQCGMQLQPEARFCSGCGAAF